MPDAQNRLIEILPHQDRLRLPALCEPVDLPVFADALSEAGERTCHVHFPVDGFISLLTRIDRAARPAGRHGRTRRHARGAGASGVPIAPLHALVQGAASAGRVGASAFKRELFESAALRKELSRYAYVLMQQLVTSASGLRSHEIGPRLARCC